LFSRRDEDLPGSWVVLFVRAMVEHPAGSDFPSPLPLVEVGILWRSSTEKPSSPSGEKEPWASGTT
jgi:hypothetical protein